MYVGGWVYVCVHTRMGTIVEVTRQLVGVCSSYNTLISPFTITKFHHKTHVFRQGHVGHEPRTEVVFAHSQDSRKNIPERQYKISKLRITPQRSISALEPKDKTHSLHPRDYQHLLIKDPVLQSPWLSASLTRCDMQNPCYI